MPAPGATWVNWLMDYEGRIAYSPSQFVALYSIPMDLAGWPEPIGEDPRERLSVPNHVGGVIRGRTNLPSRNRFEHTPASVFFSVRVLRSGHSFVNGKNLSGRTLRPIPDRALENPFTYTIE